MEPENKEKSFVIKDKRIFDETGDLRRETETHPPPPPETEPDGERRPPPREAAESSADDYLPEMNFANFVISLGTTAMFHFGDFPESPSGKPEKNLVAAKQTIDILGVLQAKTKGNLDENEKALLDGLLFELRMRFVKEKSGS